VETSDEHEPGVLEVEDLAPERLAFLRVCRGETHGILRRCDRAHRDDEALLRQLLHELAEAVTLLAEEVRRRDAHVREGELTGVLPVLADLGQDPAAGEAGQVVDLGDEQRDAFGARRAGAADDDDEVGVRGIGDEGLAAVDDVVVAIAAGGRAHRLQV
jgi:N-acetylmuramic acid 6-phosphate (MurNAc-6-P) etherase